MSEKICIVFGHKEADPEREEELERVFKGYIEKEVKSFVFCEVNKFSLQCLRILKRLKKQFNFVHSLFALTEVVEIDKKVCRQFDFDYFFFDEDFNYNVQSLSGLVKRSDYVLIQWFETLHDKDEIVRLAEVYKKPILKF